MTTYEIPMKLHDNNRLCVLDSAIMNITVN